jgi:NADP-dependent 3-hydroxy acid dehydrogenase YdfG
VSSNLGGKTAVVTGASLGIGLSIAEALIARGVRVAGLARDAGRLRELSERFGNVFQPLSCDVGDLAQVRTAIGAAREALGAIDILINNAGIGRFGAVDKLQKADWDEMLATNISGLYHCIHEVVPVMKAQGSGHIVNISSIAGTVGYPNASGYNATKFAVRGLSDALCKELEEFGIRVTAMFPGSTDTTFSGARLGPDIPTMPAGEIAETLVHILERSANCLISEVVMRPIRRKQP